jgi:hypothetical protein
MRVPLPLICGLLLAVASGPAWAQATKSKRPEPVKLPFPPQLPNGARVVTDRAPEFLRGPEHITAAVADTPPTVDFLYYPGQDYEGQPWSNWGDGIAVVGKYYSAIGDHLAIGTKGDGTHGTGTASVYEYDADAKTLRPLANTSRLLNLPAGHYTPGKIHTQLGFGPDGWLYFGTHRGSDRSATGEYHYRGDWLMRCHPATGQSEIVATGPVPKHSIPTGTLDPPRMIFYGGTASGRDAEAQGIQFFAYDLAGRKLLYSGPDGPVRAMILARSTGRVYYTAGKDSESAPLMCFDPSTGGAPVTIPGTIGIRAATEETPQGIVYAVSNGQGGREPTLYAFDVKTETVTNLGSATVGSQTYITSLDADPAGRYLYYIPGAHGGSDRDGTAVVQYDTRTGRKKVIAFLHPFYKDKYGATLVGTYSTAIDPRGDRLYVTWNVNRGGKVWDCCALTAITIPESVRTP